MWKGVDRRLIDVGREFQRIFPGGGQGTRIPVVDFAGTATITGVWSTNNDPVMTIRVPDDGRYYWRALRNVHGPYTAGDFKNGLGAPNHVVAKSTAGVMDAFASSTHIGMIFTRSLYGGDQIVEAKCEACGTNIFYRTYRSDPSYSVDSS